ncbi:MAG: nucleoside-diphosphate sugar epimerase/dehydratase [Algoriphagus sp.]|uniref:polysaccharide biosynthesis protein n=1 Tax=Algoriphagus sp. TaxID=1872435 RepID=UPI002606EEE7|nr:nucleoside-diphosphate sugar epimerase/dehydratase [Algoriphagus sp.]MDG1277487.1 nucleoside-diphosphate sugar epimerase/dehydratase [Algoriphagus sp.]
MEINLLKLKLIIAIWIRKVPFVPVSLILALDLIVVAVNFLLSYFFLSVLGNTYLPTEGILYWSLISFVVVIALMVFKGTYKSFVRFTDIYEIIRLSVIFFSALIIVVILKIVLSDNEILNSISYSFILLGQLGALVSLILYRILIKEIYLRVFKFKKNIVNTLIFGAGKSGIMVYQILNREYSPIHKVFAFFDDNPSKKGKTLFGKKILFGDNQLELAIDKFNINELIFASNKISSDRKSKIINICLNNNVEVKFLPSFNGLNQDNIGVADLRKINLEDLLGRESIKIDQEHLANNLNGKVVLVSGAGGSIGSELCRQLSKYKLANLILLDMAETALFDINEELNRMNLQFPVVMQLCDVRNRKAVTDVFRKFRPQFVFHAAAYKHVPLMESFPKLAIQTNILGTRNLADAAENYDCEKFVFVSTDKAVNPTNVMGASKRCSEIYIQSKFLSTSKTAKTQFITTRFGNVLGSNGSVIPVFTKQIESGGPVTVTDKNIVRFFMTIPEACSLVLEACTMGKGGEIFVFDMGEPVKIFDLAVKMIKLAGKVPFKDIDIRISGLRSGEKLYEELFTNLEDFKETHHPKIYIAQSIPYYYSNVLTLVNELELGINMDYNEEDLIKLLKVHIPEYKSNFSRFSLLDN